MHVIFSFPAAFTRCAAKRLFAVVSFYAIWRSNADFRTGRAGRGKLLRVVISCIQYMKAQKFLALPVIERFFPSATFVPLRHGFSGRRKPLWSKMFFVNGCCAVFPAARRSCRLRREINLALLRKVGC
jgi:hypothetical protein